MRYYFAPLEGLTDSIYRRLHHTYFGGVDRYYTPFLSPTVHRALTAREKQELPQADTLGFCVIPQLLTKNADDFLWMAAICGDLGYEEINLNAGCPSGTVTAKGKGSGLLRDVDTLDCFLNSIFSKAALPISVKTRIGYESPEEFADILAVYNRYPIKELTVHPRVRKVFYNGPVDMDCFRYAVKNSNAPVCYNGSLCTREQIREFSNSYPQIDAIMLGRGLIANPGLLTDKGTTAQVLEQFHDALLAEYTRAFGSSRNAMFRMKENWRHWLCLFEDSHKLGKRLRKATDEYEYKAIAREIFRTLTISDNVTPDWD